MKLLKIIDKKLNVGGFVIMGLFLVWVWVLMASFKTDDAKHKPVAVSVPTGMVDATIKKYYGYGYHLIEAVPISGYIDGRFPDRMGLGASFKSETLTVMLIFEL